MLSECPWSRSRSQGDGLEEGGGPGCCWRLVFRETSSIAKTEFHRRTHPMLPINGRQRDYRALGGRQVLPKPLPIGSGRRP